MNLPINVGLLGATLAIVTNRLLLAGEYERPIEDVVEDIELGVFGSGDYKELEHGEVGSLFELQVVAVFHVGAELGWTPFEKRVVRHLGLQNA